MRLGRRAWWPSDDIPWILIWLLRTVAQWTYGRYYLHRVEMGADLRPSYWSWAPCTRWGVLKQDARVGAVAPLKRLT